MHVVIFYQELDIFGAVTVRKKKMKFLTKGRSKRKPIFRNSFEFFDLSASLGVYRGVIISKTSIISKSNRAANASKTQFRNFGISKCF